MLDPVTRKTTFASFEWDAGNRGKCLKHGVSVHEIERVLTHAETLITPDPKNPAGEPRFLAIGRTRQGRYTFVVFTPRQRAAGARLRRSALATCTRGGSGNMSKKLPALNSDKQAEELLDKDLSEYISAENLQPFPFEYRPKQKSVNLRISAELLRAVRAAARRRGIPYQRYIRQALELALQRSENPTAQRQAARSRG